MKKIILVSLIIFVFLFYLSCSKKEEPKIKYWCPMHHQYISDKPGDCPICGMKLVPMEKEELKEEHKEHALSSKVKLKIKDEIFQSSGIEKIKPLKGSLSLKINAVGIVLPDERKIQTFYTKVGGWIDKLYINFHGQYVESGKPIISIYSQELYNAELEFLSAKKAYEEYKEKGFDEVKKSLEILYESAKKKLLLFDVPKNFIERLEKENLVQKTITFYSPFKGYVIGKDVFEGKRIEIGQELFKIADLSNIWIEGDIYENEAPFVSIGQNCEVELPFDLSYKAEGKISYIYPYLNEETRTVKVRVEIENKNLKLKPSMYANLKIKTNEMEGLILPQSSIIDTGERKIVFVEEKENVFEQREIKVSFYSEGKALVEEGLEEGEIVAGKGLFMLDSESKLGLSKQEHKH